MYGAPRTNICVPRTKDHNAEYAPCAMWLWLEGKCDDPLMHMDPVPLFWLVFFQPRTIVVSPNLGRCHQVDICNGVVCGQPNAPHHNPGPGELLDPWPNPNPIYTLQNNGDYGSTMWMPGQHTPSLCTCGSLFTCSSSGWPLWVT